MNPPVGAACVRMYCTGFGDCFLLGFKDARQRLIYVWIDCGALPHASIPGGSRKWFKTILEDIEATVGQTGVRLLIVTHKHLDHLSGFYDAQETFARIPVQEVWMSWIDDPANQKALALCAREKEMLEVTRKVATELDKIPVANDSRILGYATALNEVLNFSLGANLAAVGVSTEAMMDIVRAKRTPLYLKPSLTPRKLPDFDRLSIHVLGPPEAADFLKKMDPSAGAAREIYASQFVTSSHTALAAALSESAEPENSADRQLYESSFPFARHWRRSTAQIGGGTDGSPGLVNLRRLIAEYYGSDPQDPSRNWRRNDHDWLLSAGAIAIKADAFRNNTSLALAFELHEGGPVLLFPGDAQVGNWLSWHDRTGGTGPTARDLLERTVFYKAGHHGSENATLKALGLEFMTGVNDVSRNRLVSFVPTSRQVAKSKTSKSNPDGWDIPWTGLMTRLQELARGRVIRVDQARDWAERLQQEPAPKGLDPEGWKWFRNQTEVVFDPTAQQPLFVEHTVLPGRTA